MSHELCVSNPPQTVPHFMRPFIVKNAAEFFQKHFPQKTVEAIGGLISGIVPNFGVDVPDWVRQASYQFWKYYGFPKNFNAYESVQDFGVLVGMIEHCIRYPQLEPKSFVEKLLTKTAPKLVSFLAEKCLCDLSDLEKAQFYTGKHQAAEIMSKIDSQNHLDMIAIAPVYLVISVAWKEIESCGTHADRIQWLKAKKVIKKITTGDEVDKYTPSDRVVYQAFETIGLPGAKSGKPKAGAA